MRPHPLVVGPLSIDHYPTCPPARKHVSVLFKFRTFYWPRQSTEGPHSQPSFIPKESLLMPLVSMRQLLDEAAKGGYGVGAFNVNSMEQIQSIMEAARETKSPVIIQ